MGAAWRHRGPRSAGHHGAGVAHGPLPLRPPKRLRGRTTLCFSHLLWSLRRGEVSTPQGCVLVGLSGAGLFLSWRQGNQHRSRKFRSVRTPSRQATPQRPLPCTSVSMGGFRLHPRLRENSLVLCITPKSFLPSICLMRGKTQAPDDTPNPSLHPSPRKQRSFRFPLYALHPELALLPIAITCRS